MGLQALIFDVDGTLAETADIHRAAFNQVFEEFHTGWCWDRQTYSYLMNMMDDSEMLRAYNAMSAAKNFRKPVGSGILQKMALRKIQIYLAMLASGAAYLRTGIGRLIDEATRDNIAVGIVTNRPRIEFEMLVTNTLGFEALNLFDAVSTAEDNQTGTICAYGQVINNLGINPMKSVAIDDAETGIRRAATAGLNTIATPGVYTSSGRFDAAGIVVSDLGNPARPYDVIQGCADERGYVTIGYLCGLIGETQAAA